MVSLQNPPMVLPIYHIGMHQVAPETPVLKGGRGKLVKKLPNIGEDDFAGKKCYIERLLEVWQLSRTNTSPHVA